jgi:hypothetical protein
VLPRWGERSLAEITKGDVLELINDKAAKRERRRQGLTIGAAVQAGKMLVRLRTFFGWAAAMIWSMPILPSERAAGSRAVALMGIRTHL